MGEPDGASRGPGAFDGRQARSALRPRRTTGVPRSLLDPPTLTDREVLEPSGWAVLAHVEAGETVVQWRSGRAPEGRSGLRGGAADPQASEVESVRRARSQLRRYCVGNRLKFLWTLTYADEHLPDHYDGVWECIASFRRGLYARLGKRIPLAFVIERGSENDRLHVHFLAGQYLEHAMVQSVWGRGWAQYEPPPKIKGLGRRARLRMAAAYLTKYVAKDWEPGTGADAAGERPGRRFNRKRYSITTGFRPVRSDSIHRTLAEAMRYAAFVCGGEVEDVWSSDSLEDWRGPPTFAVRFS